VNYSNHKAVLRGDYSSTDVLLHKLIRKATTIPGVGRFVIDVADVGRADTFTSSSAAIILALPATSNCNTFHSCWVRLKFFVELYIVETQYPAGNAWCRRTGLHFFMASGNLRS